MLEEKAAYIMVSWVLWPYFHVDRDKLPCQRFTDYKVSTFNAYHVPISLSIHIPLGRSYRFVDLMMPKTS